MAEAVFKLRVTVEPDVDEVAAGGTILKAMDEERYLLTVAYPANKADVSVAADGHRDFASAGVVEKACWNFSLKGAKAGMWHQEGHEHVAKCVENYIYRGPDWTQTATDGTEQVIKAGDWMTGWILEPEAWALFKAGKIGGVSPQGAAKRRTPSAESLAGLR